jgi:hypothetical protein
MKRKIYFSLVIVVLLNLRGRFVIDLPEGWQLDPQTDTRVYVFKGDDKSIIMEFVANTNDAEALLNKGVGMLRMSGLENPVLEGQLTELTVNGNPARWGAYKSDMKVGKMTITLYGLLGGVSLGENGVYYLAIINKSDLAAWKEPFEKAFQSIRNVDQVVTGVSGAKEVAVVSTPGTPTAWEHKLASLTLPPGWTEKQTLKSFEKEVIGWFFYDPLPGASVLAIAYKGFGMNKNKSLKGAVKTVELSMPNSKPVNTYEIKTDGGKKAQILVYQGTSVSQGTEVGMAAIISSVKAGKCHLNLIGFVQTEGMAALEKQIVEITRTVK